MKKFLWYDTIYTIKSRCGSPYETEKYHHVVENHIVEIHVSQGIAVVVGIKIASRIMTKIIFYSDSENDFVKVP